VKKIKFLNVLALALVAGLAFTSCQTNVSEDDSTSKWAQKLEESGKEYVLDYNPYDKVNKKYNYSYTVYLSDLGMTRVPQTGDTFEVDCSFIAKNHLNGLEIHLFDTGNNWTTIGYLELYKPSEDLNKDELSAKKAYFIVTGTPVSSTVDKYALQISTNVRNEEKISANEVPSGSGNYYLGDDYKGFITLKGVISFANKGLISKTTHMEARVTGNGIEVTVKFDPDATVTFSWGSIYEETSSYYSNLSWDLKKNRANGGTNSYTYCFPFTEKGKLYTFHIGSDIKVDGRDVGINWNEKVSIPSTVTTEYGSVNSNNLKKSLTTVSFVDRNDRFPPEQEYRVITDVLGIEKNILEDLPFLKDHPEREQYVECVGQVLYGKANWVNSSWILGWEKPLADVRNELKTNGYVDTHTSKNLSGSTWTNQVKRNYPEMLKYKEYSADFGYSLKVPTSNDYWQSPRCWSAEVPYNNLPAVKYLGNVQLPLEDDTKYWYGKVDSGVEAALMLRKDGTVLYVEEGPIGDSVSYNCFGFKGTYNGTTNLLTVTHQTVYRSYTYSLVDFNSLSYSSLYYPMPVILDNGKLKISNILSPGAYIYLEKQN